MEVCENCGKPATMLRVTGRGDMPSCGTCIPGDWSGEAKPLTPPTADLSNRVTLSKQEAAAALGVSVDYFDKRVMPDLKVINRGGRVLIPRAALDEWVASSSARALKD